MFYKNIYKSVIVFLFFISTLTYADDEKALTKSHSYRPYFNTKIIRRIEIPKGYHEGLFLDDKNIFVCNGENLNIWLVDVDSGRIKSEIIPAGTFTESVYKKNNGKFIVSDWERRAIYIASIVDNKLIVESEFLLGESYPAGAIYLDGSIYVITWTRSVSGTKYHLVKYDDTGVIQDKIRIDNIPEPSQLCWDGEKLWISSWFDRHIYKVDIKQCKIEGYFSSKIEQTTGVVWDGKYFWITGTKSDLYQLELNVNDRKKK